MKRGALILSGLLFLLSSVSADLAAQGMMGEGHMRGRGPGFGRGPHGGPGMGPGRGEGMCFGDRDQMREELKITDKQIDLISGINKKFHDRLIVFRDRIRPKKEELRRLLLRDKLDLKNIRKLLKEISGLEVEIRMIRIVQRSEIEKVLTPEQRERMRRERRTHRGRWKDDR